MVTRTECFCVLSPLKIGLLNQTVQSLMAPAFDRHRLALGTSGGLVELVGVQRLDEIIRKLIAVKTLPATTNAPMAKQIADKPATRKSPQSCRQPSRARPAA